MNLKYLLIASPDKVSLNSFLKFIKTAVGKEYIIGNIHSLMSEEAKSTYIEDFIKKNEKGIFSYYARKIVTTEPLKILPAKAIEVSNEIIWFDLYSITPIILKDTENFLPPIIVNWNKYMEKLNI